jgi:hypothetical protein
MNWHPAGKPGCLFIQEPSFLKWLLLGARMPNSFNLCMKANGMKKFYAGFSNDYFSHHFSPPMLKIPTRPLMQALPCVG